MDTLPNLAGIATQGLVEKIGAGTFQAAYINWSRTMNMLREHAPGWMPELVRTAEGGILHRAPAGAYLLIRFHHLDGTVTPEVPQAVMNSRNAAIPLADITARDITDTHRRGVCLAAAFTFGLAYELWAKMPLETGFAEPAKVSAAEPIETDATPTAEASRAARCAELAEQYAESVHAIRNGIDTGDYLTAAEAWYELDQEVMRGLWVAPTKGGPFTTKQREVMRTDEFTKYRPQQEQAA